MNMMQINSQLSYPFRLPLPSWETLDEFNPFSLIGRCQKDWRYSLMIVGAAVSVIGFAHAFFSGATYYAAGFAFLGLISLFGAYYVRKYATLSDLQGAIVDLRQSFSAVQVENLRFDANNTRLEQQINALQQRIEFLTHTEERIVHDLNRLEVIRNQIQQENTALGQTRANLQTAERNLTLAERRLETTEAAFQETEERMRQTEERMRQNVETERILQEQIQQKIRSFGELVTETELFIRALMQGHRDQSSQDREVMNTLLTRFEQTASRIEHIFPSSNRLLIPTRSQNFLPDGRITVES